MTIDPENSLQRKVPDVPAVIPSDHSVVLPSLLATLRRERPEQLGYSDGSRPKPEHVPTVFDDDIWSLGWTDGRVGDLPNGIQSDEFFTNQAKLWVTQRKVDLEAEKASHEVACQSTEAEHVRRAEELKKLREMQSEVAAHSLRHNATFSMVMAIVLLLMGAFLLIADIPLTAQLATKSLGFPDAICVNPQDGTTSPYDPVQPCKAPMQVQRVEGGSLSINSLMHFRDVLVLALALAACSFIVKLLMDGVYQGHFRTGNSHKPRALTLLVVSLMFGALLVVLGMVRYGVFQAETAVLQKQSDAFQRTLDHLRKGTDMSQRAANEIDRFRGLVDQLTAKIAGRTSGPVEAGFILLTILFPLVSGVLFHFGVQNLHHWHAANKAPEDLASAEGDLQQIGERLLSEKKSMARLQALANAISDEIVVSALAKQWSSLYRHGQERGAKVRGSFDSSPSMFGRALYRLERKRG
jgi:hypothetical protein